MNLEELQRKLGSVVKLMPEPEQINAKRQLATVQPNEWRIESIKDKHVEFKNQQSGHTIVLPASYIREAHTERLDIRFKMILKGKRTVF